MLDPWRIFEILQFRPHLIFKGGTSLSKVYRAIERFSEDVDLSLSRRDLGFADDRDPEQEGISKKEARRRLDALVVECQTVVREKLVPELRRDYQSMESMILGEAPEWDGIVRELKRRETRINGMDRQGAKKTREKT